MRYEIRRDVEVTAWFIDADGNSSPVEHRVKHSPTGFEVGYAGSGPADLARSILWHHLGQEPAPELYMKFKMDFIVDMSPDEGLHFIDVDGIERWLSRQVANAG